MKIILIMLMSLIFGCATVDTIKKDPKNEEAITETLKQDASNTATDAAQSDEGKKVIDVAKDSLNSAIQREAEKQAKEKIDSVLNK